MEGGGIRVSEIPPVARFLWRRMARERTASELR
jgi:hypothetical protein